jgi:putative ABC transport system permease protein
MWKMAIQFLRFDKAKTAGALAGIMICVYLIGQQLGIFGFVMTSIASLLRDNMNYIWVVHENSLGANELQAMDVRVEQNVQSMPGVKATHPIVVAGAPALFASGSKVSVQLLGAEEPYYTGLPIRYAKDNFQALQTEEGIYVDYYDRKFLGNPNIGDIIEINKKQAKIVGYTEGARGFALAFGFTTLSRARYYANLPAYQISALLVEVEESAQENFVYAVNQYIPDTWAYSASDFKSMTIMRILKNTGIGFSFLALIIFAVASGLVIVGLTLYSAANDRIKDYGTLKAMGATSGYLRRLVFAQAFLLALIGFVLAYCLLNGFRLLMKNTGTIIHIDLWLVGILFITPLFISFVGSFFALRRIESLAPADIFKM